MKKFKKLLKWFVILGALYFVLVTLYFGYDEMDSEKGIYRFYWSGLSGVWEDDRTFGSKINKPLEIKLNGVAGPYIFSDYLFYVDKNDVFHNKEVDTNRINTIETSCDLLPKVSVSFKDSIFYRRRTI